MRLARLLPVLCVLLCAALPARAETAGQVLAAVGDALALRAGQIVRLVPGASIESGDQINTGAGSYLQIRFTDWGIIYLRPRTNFVVDEYVYEARQGGRERAFFVLLSGGIRSITGAIGHRDRANYRLRSPTATIGIRGTHYSVLICKQDCRNPDGTLGEDGLYGEVLDGRIAVSPYGGSALEREFGAGERFRLNNEHSIPLQLFSVPPFLPDGLGSQARSGAKPGPATSSAGEIVPGAGSPATDLNPIAGVTGGLGDTLKAIVPANPGTRAGSAVAPVLGGVGPAVAPVLGVVGPAVTSVSGAVITPLANGVVLPAARLAGSVVNSALSMPDLGPAFPLLGSALNSVPTVVLPAVNSVVASLPPVTAPVLPPVTVPGVPPVTLPPVTTPTLPPVTTPTLPPVTTPTLPPVTTPTLPPVTTPTLPPVTTPTLPPVTAPTLPPVTAPTLPPVTTPTLPPVTVPTLPPVTTPTQPVVTVLTISPARTPNLPTVPSLPLGTTAPARK